MPIFKQMNFGLQHMIIIYVKILIALNYCQDIFFNVSGL